jgi:hypothetical protein
MSRVTDSIRAVNSALRTFLALVVVGIVSVLGWFGYSEYTEPGRQLDVARAELEDARRVLKERQQRITQLTRDVEEKRKEIARLQTSLRLLKVDHRIAELRVLDQRENPQTGRLLSTVEFVEINDENAPIDDPLEFTIEGNMVYIEAKVVQFEDEFVEQSDPDRSTSLCLFQRLWGEFQQPHEGFPIDEVGSRPSAYARGGELTDFEKTIWQNFWEIANDEEQADELGVRTIQIEAPGMQVRPGNRYRIRLRASGGLTIVLENEPGSAEPPDPDA